MIIAAASKPFIDWNALLKIMLAALIGGSGVVIAFGILLLAVQRARSSENRESVRLSSWALAGGVRRLRDRSGRHRHHRDDRQARLAGEEGAQINGCPHRPGASEPTGSLGA